MSNTKEIKISWHFDDVKARAKETGIPLTDSECGDVLDSMKNGHDASLGISWEVMDVHIEFIVAARETENAKS